MKAAKIIGIGLVALVVTVPNAAADSTDMSTEAGATPPATTTTTTEVPSAPATTTEPPATTTTTTEVPATTTTTTEVPATTTELPVTTTTDLPTTTATTTVDGDGLGADLIPDDVMVDTADVADGCIAANCVPIAAAGTSGIPIATGGGRHLPFTGIGDVIAPILLSLVVLLAGIVAIRWAQLREAVASGMTRRVIQDTNVETRTGYAAALREQQINARARRFYEARIA